MSDPRTSEEKMIYQGQCFMNPHGKGHCMHPYTWATTAGVHTASKCCWCGSLHNQQVAIYPEHGKHV